MSSDPTLTTLPGALAREIYRVPQLREQYRDAQRRVPSAGCGPAIAMMSLSLNAAIAAAGSPDIEGQMSALRDLQEYTS